MRKLVPISALVLLLMLLTLGNTLAMDMEDPVLCVAGQWLTVDAVAFGHQDAVTVILPAGTPYGETSGCGTPSAEVIQNVAVRQGNSPVMHVEVSGDQASTPIVTATYGEKSFSKANNGKRTLVFQFNLR